MVIQLDLLYFRPDIFLTISKFQPKILNLNKKRGGVGSIYNTHTQSKIIFRKFLCMVCVLHIVQCRDYILALPIVYGIMYIPCGYIGVNNSPYIPNSL